MLSGNFSNSDSARLMDTHRSLLRFLLRTQMLTFPPPHRSHSFGPVPPVVWVDVVVVGSADVGTVVVVLEVLVVVAALVVVEEVLDVVEAVVVAVEVLVVVAGLAVLAVVGSVVVGTLVVVGSVVVGVVGSE